MNLIIAFAAPLLLISIPGISAKLHAADPQGGTSTQQSTHADGPLESLRQRSPQQRWDELKQELRQSQQQSFKTSVSRPAAGSATSSDSNIPAETSPSAREAQREFRAPLVLDDPDEESAERGTGNAERKAPISPAEIPVPRSEFPAPPLSLPLSPPLSHAPSTPPLRVAQLEPEPYREPVRDPSQLKKVSSILPYFDYEPDPRLADDDPCHNLCPRPDGRPCKQHPPGARIPECPEELPLGGGTYQGRNFDGLAFMWEASNVYHNPLYFEDVPLERYGHTHGDLVQPFVSVAKFSAQLFGMPYQMTIDEPAKCMYPLGWYRPGECAPHLYRQIPWNTKAAVVEAGVVTGLIFAIP